MHVVFILVTLMTTTPTETFSFGREFRTLTECKNFIYKDKPKDRDKMMGCLPVAKLENGKKWEDESIDTFNTF